MFQEMSQLYKLTRSVLFQNQTETLSMGSPLSSVVFSGKHSQNKIHNRVNWLCKMSLAQNLSNGAENLDDNQITNSDAFTTLGGDLFLVIWIILSLFSSTLLLVSLSVVQT